jgi:hypothetical protein
MLIRGTQSKFGLIPYSPVDVAGMICMTPRAPALLTARGLKNDSECATANANETGTPIRRASMRIRDFTASLSCGVDRTLASAKPGNARAVITDIIVTARHCLNK